MGGRGRRGIRSDETSGPSWAPSTHNSSRSARTAATNASHSAKRRPPPCRPSFSSPFWSWLTAPDRLPPLGVVEADAHLDQALHSAPERSGRHPDPGVLQDLVRLEEEMGVETGGGLAQRGLQPRSGGPPEGGEACLDREVPPDARQGIPPVDPDRRRRPEAGRHGSGDLQESRRLQEPPDGCVRRRERRAAPTGRCRRGLSGFGQKAGQEFEGSASRGLGEAFPQEVDQGGCESSAP